MRKAKFIVKRAGRSIASACVMFVLFSDALVFANDGSESIGFPFSSKYQGDNWEIAVIGRIQQDFTVADADIADFHISDSELRRLRAGFQGKHGSSFKYKIEIEIDTSGDATVKDAFVAWRPEGLKTGVMAGQFNTPNSLDYLTSSRFTSTVERAGFVNAFGFNRRIGFGVFSEGRAYTLTAAVFGETLKQNPLHGSFAIAGRATYNPLITDNALVHLGASLRYRDQSTDDSLINFSERPYAHVAGKIIGTSEFAESDFFSGAELAATYNNIWAAGEYGRSHTNCPICATDPDFDGYYIEAGIFLGGSRGYKKGKFDRPVINRTVLQGGPGAVSFVARFDSVDLTDNSTDGGALDTVIFGAEWWPTAHAKMSLNYFNADVVFGDTTTGLDPAFAAIVSTGAIRDEVEGVTLRLQVEL